MKLINNNDLSIPIFDMKDGEIGIITTWGSNVHINTIVQRYNNILISLGKDKNNSWDNIFDRKQEGYRVRILQQGETLEIE